MNLSKGSRTTPSRRKIRRSAVIMVICDAVLMAALLLCILTYIQDNNVKTYNQNIESISNIATAKSELMTLALDSTCSEVRSAYQYCNGKSIEEILDYLGVICDEDDEYQLLERNAELSTEMYHIYSGYSINKSNGDYAEIEYKDTDIASSIYSNSDKQNGEISFSQSFTNKTDGMRYFAVFCGITAEDGGSTKRYFLLKPQKENQIIDHLNMYSQFSELSTAVCYEDGKYLARDNSFRSDSFYDYLYNYNGLSIEERNEIREAVSNDDDGSGYFEFKDYKERSCVFAYALCQSSENWKIIVAVPVSEFVSAQLLSFFPLIIITFLIVLLVFNIASLLNIVHELHLSVEREQVANRSKSSFLSRMSHEIRTPLNAVIGYNAIAKNSITEGQSEAQRRQAEMKVMDCLVKSEVASKHLLTVINDVLDMSAIESGKMKVESTRFDFKGLISSLTTIFYSQAKTKDVNFEVVFHTLSEEWFVGDQMRTNQVLTNLLSNAIKFTNAGGTVRLLIEQNEADAKNAHIHFEVKDTGIGMSPEYLEHIWEAFEQADSSISRRFGGSGLGLSITKNLVDLMGGSITVESEPGKGTTFNVELTYERTEQPQRKGIYDFSHINALVVDDDISTCDYIRILFNRCGAKCTAVTSGHEALNEIAAAIKSGEPYTMCFVDWRMPKMDGIETVRRIRSLTENNMPVMILTAYDYSEIAEKATQAGVTGFVSKPFFQSSLFDLLANIGEVNDVKPVKEKKKGSFEGVRVILAEDNAMNMEIAKVVMESEGIAVDSAWNGKEAVDIFESSEPGTYTAIFMDVHMPEMDGHEATRKIRASEHPEGQTIPIIAMTADAFAENVAEARACGMNGHISKPLDIQVLFDTLREFM